MTTVRIPDWNRAGVLPPFIPSRPVSQDRSPYRVTLSDLIEHFGTTPARRKIWRGFWGIGRPCTRWALLMAFSGSMVALLNG